MRQRALPLDLCLRRGTSIKVPPILTDYSSQKHASALVAGEKLHHRHVAPGVSGQVDYPKTTCACCCRELNKLIFLDWMNSIYQKIGYLPVCDSTHTRQRGIGHSKFRSGSFSRVGVLTSEPIHVGLW